MVWIKKFKERSTVKCKQIIANGILSNYSETLSVDHLSNFTRGHFFQKNCKKL